ncbi:hypothetical protein BDK51DRAFT_41839 [Blyttiomyces helicus]|uniref:Uncharacterized protein n=1 Tax=Blyttiomyces helicus TaxID=388810 RepID=A0A4P9WKT8_9FUNG|nr:hypothetical protein BDK51DRAFT_41839 [Blyttiomyces helicus]|eukprot:RKO93012.1 hypothetical protein BDK51DRAFT_41839 [Blyttiomyces helicus]
MRRVSQGDKGQLVALERLNEVLKKQRKMPDDGGLNLESMLAEVEQMRVKIENLEHQNGSKIEALEIENAALREAEAALRENLDASDEAARQAALAADEKQVQIEQLTAQLDAVNAQQESLNRINDVLQRQRSILMSETAGREGLDLERMLEEVQNMQAKIAAYEQDGAAQFTTLQDENAELRAEMQRANDRSADYAAQIETLAGESEAARAEQARLEALLADQESKIAAMDRLNKLLDKQRSALMGATAGSGLDIEATLAEIERMQARIVQLESNTGAQSHALEAEHSQLKESVATLQDENADLRAEMQSASDRSAEYAAQIETLAGEAEAARAEQARLEALLADQESKIAAMDRLNKLLDKQRSTLMGATAGSGLDIEATLAEIERMQARIVELESNTGAQAHALEAENSQLKQSVATLKMNLDDLTRQAAEASDADALQIQALSKEVDAARAEQEILQKSLEENQEKLAAMDRLTNVLKKQRSVLIGENAAANSKAGSASAIEDIIETIEEMQARIQQLEAGTGEQLRKLLEENSLLKKERGDIDQRLEGFQRQVQAMAKLAEVLSAQQPVGGGTGTAALSATALADLAVAQIEASRKSAEQVRTLNELLVQERNANDKQIAGYKKQLEAMDRLTSVLKNQKAALSGEKAKKEEDVLSMVEMIEQVRVQLEASESNGAQVKALNELLRQERNSTQMEISGYKRQLEALDRLVAALKSKRGDFEVAAAKDAETIKSITAELEVRKGVTAELAAQKAEKAELLKKTAEIRATDDRITKALQAEIAQLKKDIEDYKSQVATLTRVSNALKSQRNLLVNETVQAEEEVGSMGDLLGSTQTKLEASQKMADAQKQQLQLLRDETKSLIERNKGLLKDNQSLKEKLAVTERAASALKDQRTILIQEAVSNDALEAGRSPTSSRNALSPQNTETASPKSPATPAATPSKASMIPRRKSSVSSTDASAFRKQPQERPESAASNQAAVPDRSATSSPSVASPAAAKRTATTSSNAASPAAATRVVSIEERAASPSVSKSPVRASTAKTPAEAPSKVAPTPGRASASKGSPATAPSPPKAAAPETSTPAGDAAKLKSSSTRAAPSRETPVAAKSAPPRPTAAAPSRGAQ